MLSYINPLRFVCISIFSPHSLSLHSLSHPLGSKCIRMCPWTLLEKIETLINAFAAVEPEPIHCVEQEISQRALGFVWHGHRRCNGDVKCRRENALSEPRRAIGVIVPRLWSHITHRLPDSLSCLLHRGTGSNTRLSSSLRYGISIMVFEDLPVDLIAEILGELDLESLVQTSYVCRRFYLVASDASLNPWRRPIMLSLRTHTYEKALKHLSIRMTVPRQNWIDILAAARPSFILFEATLPNLKAVEWEECFKRRFLPSWVKWRKDSSWKEAFLKSVPPPNT